MPDAPDLGTALGLGDFLTEESKLEKTIYLCDDPEPFIQGVVEALKTMVLSLG